MNLEYDMRIYGNVYDIGHTHFSELKSPQCVTHTHTHTHCYKCLIILCTITILLPVYCINCQIKQRTRRIHIMICAPTHGLFS